MYGMRWIGHFFKPRPVRKEHRKKQIPIPALRPLNNGLIGKAATAKKMRPKMKEKAIQKKAEKRTGPLGPHRNHMSSR